MPRGSQEELLEAVRAAAAYLARCQRDAKEADNAASDAATELAKAVRRAEEARAKLQAAENDLVEAL